MSHSMCFQPFEEHSSTQTSLRKLILLAKTEHRQLFGNNHLVWVNARPQGIFG